jgi:hypothetical protein
MSSVDDVFTLKDFFQHDPFHRTSGTITAFSNYSGYLQSLGIIWQRIKDGSRAVGDCHAQVNKILSSEKQHTDESVSLEMKELGLLKVLEVDIETFILFARRFMDMVAKLIEEHIAPPKGMILEEDGFTEHKALFTKEHSINPIYSKFLEDKTYWYEQELQMYRNKIFVHGKPLKTLPKVSPHSGISFIKVAGLTPLEGDNKRTILKIKRDYERHYSDLHISENPYEVMNELLREVSIHDIIL